MTCTLAILFAAVLGFLAGAFLGSTRASKPQIRPPKLQNAPHVATLYDRLKAAGAGYCYHCGAVITPDDLKTNPIEPVR